MNQRSIFVVKIDLSLAKKLKADLEDQGFSFSKPPYTVFCAKKKGVSCALYESGKLTVQGKGIEEFITFYLEPQILGEFSFSYPDQAKEAKEEDLRPRIGVDEAGKGDFFGPLCVGAVFADEKGLETLEKLKVCDSKKIKDDKIIKLATQIRSKLPHSLVVLYPSKYNELYQKFQNLNQLLAWGHAAAITELVETTGCNLAAIDQFASEWVVERALERKGMEITLEQSHRGESDPVIAAASILARSAFVQGIDKLSKMANFTLPKGASSQVIVAGKKIFSVQGEEMLGKLAKKHFKTWKTVTDATGSSH